MANSHSASLSRHWRTKEGGFSLLEMVVAMLILTIGLLGVASAVGYALMVSNSGRGLTNAKLLVVSALEQMETLRDTNQLNFAEITNADPPGSFSGFSSTFVPVSTTSGADYVFGTFDDPGRTDPNFAIKGVERKLTISELSPTLKQIRVTLRYSPNGRSSAMPPGMCEDTPAGGDRTHGDRETRCLTCVSYLNDDAHGNYVP